MMKKKIIALTLCLITLLSLTPCISFAENTVRMISPDGSSFLFYEKDVPKLLQKGWSLAPNQNTINDGITIYAPDGRIAVVPIAELDAYLAVGWSTEYPFQTIYAPDGRTASILKTELDAYLAVGWFSYPACNVYKNGKSILIASTELENYKKDGWSTFSSPREAYDILKAYIMKNGTYDAEYEQYRISRFQDGFSYLGSGLSNRSYTLYSDGTIGLFSDCDTYHYDVSLYIETDNNNSLLFIYSKMYPEYLIPEEQYWLSGHFSKETGKFVSSFESVAKESPYFTLEERRNFAYQQIDYSLEYYIDYDLKDNLKVGVSLSDFGISY